MEKGAFTQTVMDGEKFNQWLGQADGSFLPSPATYQMPTDWTIQPEDNLL